MRLNLTCQLGNAIFNKSCTGNQHDNPQLLAENGSFLGAGVDDFNPG
jgi:hypothetical protein